MKKTCLLLSLMFSLLYVGCSKDEPSPSEPASDAEAEKVYNEVVKPQEDNYNLLIDLFSQMDTLSAMDSILKVFLKDPSVDWGEVGAQGIAIQYKSGIRGGLFINPLRGELEAALSSDKSDQNNAISDDVQKVVPGSKKTIFLNASYSGSFIHWTDQIVEKCKDRFPLAGYQAPLIYKNEEVNIEKFMNLEDYGIVRFDSHGWAWPSSDKLTDVYIVTGEYWSITTFLKYAKDLISGDISILSQGASKSLFALSPEFISKHNNFKNDTTLIYGGFCYSYLGSWPEIMVNTAGAGGYFGYDWAVKSSKDMNWCMDLFNDLTDKNIFPPQTASKWMNNSVEKFYWNDDHDRNIYIKYWGYPDLALIKSKVKVDLSQITEVSCDVIPTIEWNCGELHPYLSIHKIRQPVKITAYQLDLEWEETRTFTGSVDVQDIGELRIKFDSTFTRIESYYASNTYNYMADSAKLAQYGYPNTKIQTYSGGNLPIWVNEPSQSRYIYGVSGSDASSYLDILECEYHFPDGSGCSIDDYEFTDDVMQMIRFDFHIK